MAPHENVFYAEKHSNDSLHNPQRKGTDHTSKEIQIAARLLGRTSVISDEKTRKKMERENAIEKRKEKLLENAKPLGWFYSRRERRLYQTDKRERGDDEETKHERRIWSPETKV